MGRELEQRVRYLLTTSHKPSQRTRTFLKDLASVLPNSERVSRGKAALELLGSIASDLGAERVIIVKEKNGNPHSIEVYSVDGVELVPLGTIVLRGLSLSSETGRRVYNVKKVCIDENAIDEETKEIIGNLRDLLGLGECEGDEDLVASVERDERGFEVIFRPSGSNLKVGPVIRIARVDRRSRD
ncbi:Brix [Ignicoccus islandicus DSM 13165]|uniref:Probable Brix domain-containing ribosomal biogenesis protein n=1 Tax=Ignicoccus islandicus DSM 13165 TaxID=940295 RepID=A0A0U3F2Q9_9CREN|nr:hypothetical protein [Ignicoccus islandicus]ALU11813.1 Brix [Ignicoccus islandicus DSM 13165]